LVFNNYSTHVWFLTEPENESSTDFKSFLMFTVLHHQRTDHACQKSLSGDLGVKNQAFTIFYQRTALLLWRGWGRSIDKDIECDILLQRMKKKKTVHRLSRLKG
jgi:hypothetical protein